jgi:hypothetical protein
MNISTVFTRLFSATNIDNCNATAPVGQSGYVPPKCYTNLPNVAADDKSLQIIFQMTFGIVAAVAVLIIVLAGMTYTRSLGNPDIAAKARKTIIYATVGLTISLVAEFAVTFVIGRL